ncbi:MAG: hypothetical protein RSB38_09025 [Oscillospiraceae bacterium]
MEAIIIKADDWEGLFVDGKLVYENHEIDRLTLRELCEDYSLNFVKIGEVWVTDEFKEYLWDVGSFPENLSEVEYEPS